MGTLTAFFVKVFFLSAISIFPNCNANGSSSVDGNILEAGKATLAESSWNSTHENPLITAVTLKTANPLNADGFHADTLFKAGKLQGKWATCKSQGVRLTDCVVLSSYVDRLSLIYSYDPDSIHEYTFTLPSIKSLTSGGKPTISNFDHDGRHLEFTVFFNCLRKESGNSTEVYDLNIPILRNFSIESRFAKQCESGPHPYVALGMKNGSRESLISEGQAPLRVGPETKSTQFFIRVLPPARSIVHENASIIVEGSDVGAQLRGISQKTDIVRGSDLMWWVTYDCEKGVEANITVSVPIPPWDDLTVRVTKTCRGGAPEMLMIGSGPDLSDIIKSGKATTAYNITAPGHLAGVDDRVVGSDDNLLNLFIRNMNMVANGDMHLGRLLVTVSNKSIARVTATFSDGSESQVVKAGRHRIEVVRFVCLEEGRVVVVFSLPVLEFEVVEFGVIKECVKPEAITRMGWRSLLTVNGLEDLFLVLVAFALVVYCIRNRGKTRFTGPIRRQQYEEVASEE